jgi:hypothetical protein
MSLLDAQDGPGPLAEIAYALGRAFVKHASADDPPQPAYDLSGLLYLSSTGWLMLSVPNAMVHGIFSALDAPGVELPPGGATGKFNAHISVMRPDEVELIGGADAITERGKRFAYTLGRLYAAEPDGWPEMAKVWFVRVHSPALQDFRKSYGLSPLPSDGKYDFHVTIGVRRRGVLARGDTRVSR